MSSYTNLVEEKFKEALKNKDTMSLSILRMLKAGLVNERISKQKELTDDEEISVLRREVKKRLEAVSSYNSAGATDRAKAEMEEAQFIKQMLPPEMTNEDIVKIVQNIISSNSYSGMSDFGKVMGSAMKEVGNGASGDVVSAVVKAELSKNI